MQNGRQPEPEAVRMVQAFAGLTGSQPQEENAVPSTTQMVEREEGLVMDLSGFAGLAAEADDIFGGGAATSPSATATPATKPTPAPQVEAPKGRLTRRNGDATPAVADISGEGPDPRLAVAQPQTHDVVPARPTPQAPETLADEANVKPTRTPLPKRGAKAEAPQAEEDAAPVAPVAPANVRTFQSKTRAGDEIHTIDFEFVDVDENDFMELSMRTRSKLAEPELRRLVQYERVQYHERSAIWNEIATILLHEVNAMPRVPFEDIYGEIERATVVLKQEPTFYDCLRLLGEVYNNIQRLTTLKTRLLPVVATVDSAYTTLLESWKSISTGSSDDTRTGEAKLRLEPLIRYRNKVRALSDTLTERIVNMKIAWDTVSRQQSALEQALNAGPRRPADVNIPEFEEKGFQD